MKSISTLKIEQTVIVYDLLSEEFVGSMDKLFDEDILLGRGWTTHESLRPLAYSTLADLVHHVRQHLNIHILAKAVHLFSKNVHDESLPTSIQVNLLFDGFIALSRTQINIWEKHFILQ